MQVSDADPAKWNLALNNARNIQTDLGAANVDIEVVAYGPGIGMLKADSVVGNRIDEALGAGVKVVACENTMRGQKLTQGRHAEQASATCRPAWSRSCSGSSRAGRTSGRNARPHHRARTARAASPDVRYRRAIIVASRAWHAPCPNAGQELPQPRHPAQ